MTRPTTGATGSWRIASATAADLEELADLESSAFPHPWNRALLADELAHPHAVLLTARDGETAAPAAYAAFRIAAGDGELLRLATAPAARGRGAARALLDAGLARLAAAGCARCHLEVRADNAAAIALYLRRGFTRQGLRRGYYADGGDAVLFALTLEGERDGR